MLPLSALSGADSQCRLCDPICSPRCLTFLAVFPLGVLRLEKGQGSGSPSFSPLRKLLGFLGAFLGRRDLFPDLGKMVLSARRWTGSPLPGPGGGRPASRAAPPGNRSAFRLFESFSGGGRRVRCPVSVIKTGRPSRPGGRFPAFRPLTLPEQLTAGKTLENPLSEP